MPDNGVKAVVYVCQAGSCRRAGSEAVQLEIEELAKQSGQNCSVEAHGCVGACSQAPNAVVVKRQHGKYIGERLHKRIEAVEKSADIVHDATGQVPNLDDPALRARFAEARQLRIRQQARAEGKWNVAMAGFAEQITGAAQGNAKLQLQYEFAQLCCSAGLCDRALPLLAELEKAVGDDSDALLIEKGKALGKLGRTEELRAMIEYESGGRLRRGGYPSYIIPELKLFLKDASSAGGGAERCRVDGYVWWTLAAVTPVSQHSAVYHLTTRDLKRGTPYLRGRGRTMWHKTWHTTMLFGVGPNAEGPLPWVERDYTPVSTWKEWERGNCDILIKIYRQGVATSWLHQQPLGTRLMLSQPRKTLDVPSLMPDLSRSSLGQQTPRGVLLVLGGTGIVVAPQVLHHTDPATCFGTSLGQPAPLSSSAVSVVYACRSDDVLLAPELTAWCSAGAGGARLQRCVLAVSPPGGGDQETDVGGAAPPFPGAPGPALDALRELPNVRIVESRVTRELLESELASVRSSGACRVVVSGPESFNQAVKDMLQGAGLDAEAITILEA